MQRRRRHVVCSKVRLAICDWCGVRQVSGLVESRHGGMGRLCVFVCWVAVETGQVRGSEDI